MSNPGVIYLNSKRLSSGIELRLEDNIGESIHIHYGKEVRLDLTVNEFMTIQKKASECLEDLLYSTGFRLKYFDPCFLDMISEYLIDLIDVSFETVRLSQLKVCTEGFLGLPVVRTIEKSRIIKALNGSTKELESYKQENYRGQSNIDRVNDMYSIISKKGYPFDEKYIVLFNDQMNIRDGQHRAACLYSIYGDMDIKVIRLSFKDNRYNVPQRPWFRYIFKWDLPRLKRAVKKTLKMVLHFVKRVINKLLRILKIK